MCEGISNRGFASMSPERRKEVAAMGGRRTQKLKKGHLWTRDEARDAARKGGKVSKRRKRVEQLV